MHGHRAWSMGHGAWHGAWAWAWGMGMGKIAKAESFFLVSILLTIVEFPAQVISFKSVYHIGFQKIDFTADVISFSIEPEPIHIMFLKHHLHGICELTSLFSRA